MKGSIEALKRYFKPENGWGTTAMPDPADQDERCQPRGRGRADLAIMRTAWRLLLAAMGLALAAQAIKYEIRPVG
jgi:hypothetical protein